MLIEFHILQNHAPSNLNRDDTGSPKECLFGNYTRARISSQCLKRTIRRSDIFQQALAGQLATRTRRLPELVRERLMALEISPEFADIAVKKASGFGTKEGKETDKGETAQSMFLTESDIAAVTEVLREAVLEAGTPKKFQEISAKDLQAKSMLKGFRPVSVDVALFGRMTTSEAFRDVEASCQVAHALSTHKIDHEFDYFTAVDDLQGQSENEDDAGADMIGDVEFNSACYYKYLSVDVDGLVDNLTGASAFSQNISADDISVARETAGKTLEALLKAAVMTTPSGKQNSFAAHQLPSLVLVEARPYKTPVSYANAFVDPARADKEKGLVQASLMKFGAHVTALTSGFNLEATSRWLLAPEQTDYAIAGVERAADLKALSDALRQLVTRHDS